MIKFIIHQNNQAKLIEKINQLDPTERFVCDIKPFAEKRTELQNKISHAWYGELANSLKENDALGYKCFCKLVIGVPILRAENSEFRESYDLVIKVLSYENKLEAMKILPVTSIMTTKQLSQYLESMKDYFMKHNGFELRFPQDYYV